MADDLEALILALRIQAETQEAQKEFNATTESLDRLDGAAKRAKKSVGGVGDSAGIPPKANAEVNQLSENLGDVDEKAKKAGKSFFSLANIARTAFGTFVAMAIFKVTTAITDFFTNTLMAASQFRSEMAELNLAEAILSKKGMDITRQEFDGFIKDIESRSIYLSKLDATKVVADTAGAVQEFDVSKQQLKELADSIAFIQLKNKMLGREEADAAHIINAAMDARSNFFNGMGINITETIVKEKAYQMQLVKSGEELTKQQRFQAILALLTEQTADKQEELNEQLAGTPLGNQLKIQKEMADTTLRIGNAFITVRDNLIEMLAGFSPDLANSIVAFFESAAREANIFIDSLEDAGLALQTFNDLWKTFTGEDISETYLGKALKNLMDALNPFEVFIALLQGVATTIATLLAPIITFVSEIAAGFDVKQAMHDAGVAAGQAYVSGMSTTLSTLLKGEEGKIATTIRAWWKANTGVDLDTFQNPKIPVDNLRAGEPTGTAPDGGVSEIPANVEDLKGALAKMNQEILEAQVKLAQDMEDAAIDLGRKLLDIDAEYAKKRGDAWRDYNKKVRDINLDYNNKIREINASATESRQKAQNDALEKEAEFQNKMKELQENFLMSLEDALYSRDARQVLKLTKQYELDKLQAERKHALDMSSSAKDEAIRQKKFVADRRAAERDRQFKLNDAQRDYQDKLDSLEREESAEREAAKLANQRKIEDLQKANRDRMAIIAANLVNEFNLTKKGLDAILKLFRVYYGNGGYIQQVMAGMQTMLNTGATSQKATSTSFYKPTSRTAGGFAEGGTVIANRPTKAIFGEAGLEMATFTPIGRKGQDVNKIFTSMSGMPSGNSGGAVSIELLLSPDLEARVVSNTLDKTADIITKIKRSK